MLRKSFVIAAATTLLAATSVAAFATSSSRELVFSSDLVSFDSGTIGYCSYGEGGMGATFTSDEGHEVLLSFSAKQGNITLEGPVGATGLITDGFVQDSGQFLFKGIISDNNEGKNSAFVFSGSCATPSEQPAPEQPEHPTPANAFSMVTTSGKLNLAGTKIAHCTVGSSDMDALLISDDGHDVKVNVSNGKGQIEVSTIYGSNKGVITKGHTDTTGSFVLNGLMSVNDKMDTFILSGKCTPAESK